MFEPLIKSILRKLDVGIEAYLERQQIINLLAIPSTILFLLLFWAFSGAGGAMLLLGVLLTTAEVGAAGGLFLLKEKYRDQIQEWTCAADAIEAQLTASDTFGEWTDFLQNPAGDPELKQIRELCQNLPDQYPPQAVGEYCGPEGLKLLQDCIERLRAGIASKAYEDFAAWRAVRKQGGGRAGASGRRSARTSKRKGTPAARGTAREEAADVVRVPTMSGAFLDEETAARVDAEAEQESRRETKLVGRTARKDAKTARKATKKAVKEEKKFRRHATMLEAREDEMVLYEDDTDEEPAGRDMQAPVQAPMQPPVPESHEDDEEEEEVEPAPPPPAPKRRRQRGLTEASAIQKAMRAGLTAHHYDEAQHQLASKLGRDPRPAEVLKALTAQFSKRSQRRWAKAKAKQAKSKTGQVKSPIRRPMQAFRIDGTSEKRASVQREPTGPVRTFARVVFVLAILAGSPFLAWRVPRPETKPLIITGEVRHQILDHAPDMQHQLRTPFEQLFGNKPVMLVDGNRLYVSAEDYVLCWPESWDEIYEGGYSVMITAEVRQLIFGGYSVASISSAERVYRPVATGSDLGIAPASDDPPVRRWRQRGLRKTGLR